MRIYLGVLFLLLTEVAFAGTASLRCTPGPGGMINCRVEIRGEDFPADCVGFVITRSTAGMCDGPLVDVGPFHDPSAGPAYSWIYPIADSPPDVTERIELMGMTETGDLFHLTGGTEYCPWDHLPLGDDAVLRGQLYGTAPDCVTFIPCASGCWDWESPTFPITAEDLGVEIVGFTEMVERLVVIDLHGRYNDWCGIDVDPRGFIPTTFEIYGSDCSHVGNRPMSWGALKSRFR